MARDRGRLFLFPESSCRADTRGGWNVLGPGQAQLPPPWREGPLGSQLGLAGEWQGHLGTQGCPGRTGQRPPGRRGGGRKERTHSYLRSEGSTLQSLLGVFHLKSVSGHEGRVWSHHVGLPLVQEGRITLAFLGSLTSVQWFQIY